MCRMSCFAASLIILIAAVSESFALDENSNANDVKLWFHPWEAPSNIKINQDVTTQLQNEEQVAVNPKDPDNLVAVWRDFRLGYRRVGWGYTFDGGQTWEEGGLLSGTPYTNHSDPGIDYDTSGTFIAHVLSYDDGVNYNGLFSTHSLEGGKLWWPMWTTAVDGEVGAFEDKQLMAVDHTSGATSNNVYIAWTRFTSVSQIFCVASTDNGVSYGPARLVSDQANVQWPEPAVGPNGEVYVAWISFSRSEIMFDRSFDEGVTWGTDRMITSTALTSATISGGILVFAFPVLDVDIYGGPYHGRLYCAFTEFDPSYTLDIFLTYSDDQGDTWSTPVRVNDDPVDLHVDQFHPWLTVNPDGVVSLVWLDRRLDPEMNLDWDTYITHSFDGGQTFTPNQRVSNTSSSPADAMLMARAGADSHPFLPDPGQPLATLQPQAGLIGEYIGLATSKVRSNVVWTDTRNGNQDVYAAAMNLRLFPPKLETPADGEIITESSPILTWSDWSDYDSALTYAMEYSLDPGFLAGVTRIDGLTTSEVTAGPLSDGLYYWRVRAFDHYGDSSGWALSSFQVDTEPPAVPVMIAPPDGSRVYEAPLVFEWNAVSATGTAGSPVTYILDLAEDVAFTTNVQSVPGIEETAYEWPLTTDPLTEDIDYYWRVIAVDGAGNSSDPPSEPFSFLLASYRPGDMNLDGNVNPVDVVILVNYVYRDLGEIPEPPARKDINCDGALGNPVDVVWLVNFVYKSAIPELEICPY
jgi:hypothetical protein